MTQMRRWEMDAIGREELMLREVPIPQPDRGEVLVRVAAVALNYRDKMVVENGRDLPLAFPFTPGSDLAGTVVLVGVPTPDMTLEMPLIDFFSRGGALKSSWYGDCLPERDFPALVDLYEQGRLPLDKFVSERIKLDQVEEAFDTMHRGEVLRSVVVL